MISFSGRYFLQDMIMQSVRWYLAYSLSYRDIEEIIGRLRERCTRLINTHIITVVCDFC
ncbi:MAG: transposase-like protein [Candidatus Azotimanducaceae bacterium]|jgi:transposase-like protein